MATTIRSVMVAAALALVLAAAERPARACGGFFCDAPQVNQGPPIAQSGENVLFVMDTDPQTGQNRVEAHIQIVYTGTADQFSWVVPLTAAPELDTGTDAEFSLIEPATRPTFTTMYQQEGTCQGQSSGGGIGCGSFSGASAGVEDSAGGTVNNNGGVEVAFRGNVGPYEAITVRADDPQTLRDFLTNNGYYVSPAASKIIDDYVAAHDYFVALRLQQGKDTSAIQPIVLRLAADEACLPLKLTAIASTPDLRISVWVLAAARAVPLTYTEVSVNLAKLDWFSGGQNYDSLLGTAADEAQGNAFSVEYAQSSATVGNRLTQALSIETQLRIATNPSVYMSTLTAAGLAPTGDVLSALQRHIPEPQSLITQGVTAQQFYQSLGTYYYSQPTAFAQFDPVALTTDLDMTVFQPLAKAQALFASHPYLTRLATFISPEEMTKDPLFVTNPDLGDYSNLHMAVAHVMCGDEDYSACNAPVRLQLEGNQDVWYKNPAACRSNYDRTDLDALPSADMGWRRDPVGTGDVIIDNTAAITSALAKHNAAVSASVGGGCGCAVRRGAQARPVGAALALLAAVALCVRRRRRRG
jgi:MYXO-CTERM domain-containing protein